MSEFSGTWAEGVSLEDRVYQMSPTDHQRRLDLLIPDIDHFRAQHFAMGLQANKTEFGKVVSEIITAFNKNKFYNFTVEGSIDYYTAGSVVRNVADAIAKDLLKRFPSTNLIWNQLWLHTIFLAMWKESEGCRVQDWEWPAVEQRSFSDLISESKKSSASQHILPPISADQPDLLPPPLAQSLARTSITLTGFLSDRRSSLFPRRELAISNCVNDNGYVNEVDNCRLDLFMKAFEELNKELMGGVVNLRRGTIEYKISEMKFKRVESQKDFEEAISHMCTSTMGDKLEFYFFNESSMAMRQRTAMEKAQGRNAQKPSATKTPQKGPSGASTPGPSPANVRFTKQPNTKARLSPTSKAPSSLHTPFKRRNSILRSVDHILAKRRSVSSLTSSEDNTPTLGSLSPDAPQVFTPAGPSSVFRGLRRALAVRHKPRFVASAESPKDDHYQKNANRFSSLYEVEKTIMYARGGAEDLIEEAPGSPVGKGKGVNRGEKKGVESSQVDAGFGIYGFDEEVDEEEEEEEEEEEPQEYMATRLQKLLSKLNLSHVYTHGPNTEWENCCRFFQIDSSRTGLEDNVQVFGLTKPLYQYQAFAVYWQMAKSRVFGGGFLADDPGLGKTLTYLAYIVVERQLSWLWNDVTDSRTDNDGRHLQTHQHKPNDICPSKANFKHWIACPCASSSPTYRMKAKPGLRLAVVPDNLVNSWKSAFQQYVKPGSPLEMRLIVANPASNPVGGSGWDVLDSRHATSEKAIKSRKIMIGKRGKYGDDEPQAGQDRCLIVTTAFYYKDFAKKFEYAATYKSYDKNGNEVWTNGTNPGLVFGIAMVDEFHEDGHWQKGKGRSQVLASLPKINEPYLWGYSGTPFSTSPRVLEGILWALESHCPKKNMANKKTGWEESESYHPFSNKEFDKMCVSFQMLNSRQERADERFRADSNQFFATFTMILQSFMIRRTAEMSWFGRPLVALKPHFHTDILLKRNEVHLDLLQQLNNVVEGEVADKLKQVQDRWHERDEEYKATHSMPRKLTFNTNCRVRWRLRLIATFPFLVTLADKTNEDHLELTVEEFVGMMGPRVKESPYFRNLKKIVESSPKAMWLHSFILRMLQERDVDGDEPKLVIVTNFNPVALILKLFIEQYIKGARGRVGGIYAGVRQRERTAIIDAFTDAVDDKGKRKQAQNFQFLVGTTRFISTGLQLTRACHLVLMEPDFEFSHEIQTYLRIHRIGQRNPTTYSHRLIVQREGIERQILTRQTIRNEFPGRLVKQTTPEEFEEAGEEREREGEDEGEEKRGGSEESEDLPIPLTEPVQKKHQLKRTENTTRKSNESRRSGSQGRPTLSQGGAVVRDDSQSILRFMGDDRGRLPTEAGPSRSPSTRDRGGMGYARGPDDYRPEIPVPPRSSSLSRMGQGVVEDSPSRGERLARGGSTSRGVSRGRGSIPRKPIAGSELPALTRSRGASRGRSGSRGVITRNPLSGSPPTFDITSHSAWPPRTSSRTPNTNPLSAVAPQTPSLAPNTTDISDFLLTRALAQGISPLSAVGTQTPSLAEAAPRPAAPDTRLPASSPTRAAADTVPQAPIIPPLTPTQPLDFPKFASPIDSTISSQTSSHSPIIIKSIGNVPLRQPVFNPRPRPSEAEDGGVAPTSGRSSQGSPGSHGYFDDAMTQSPGQESFQGVTRASSEPLPEAETSEFTLRGGGEEEEGRDVERDIRVAARGYRPYAGLSEVGETVLSGANAESPASGTLPADMNTPRAALSPRRKLMDQEIEDQAIANIIAAQEEFSEEEEVVQKATNKRRLLTDEEIEDQAVSDILYAASAPVAQNQTQPKIETKQELTEEEIEEQAVSDMIETYFRPASDKAEAAPQTAVEDGSSTILPSGSGSGEASTQPGIEDSTRSESAADVTTSDRDVSGSPAFNADGTRLVYTHIRDRDIPNWPFPGNSTIGVDSRRAARRAEGSLSQTVPGPFFSPSSAQLPAFDIQAQTHAYSTIPYPSVRTQPDINHPLHDEYTSHHSNSPPYYSVAFEATNDPNSANLELRSSLHSNTLPTPPSRVQPKLQPPPQTPISAPPPSQSPYTPSHNLPRVDAHGREIIYVTVHEPNNPNWVPMPTSPGAGESPGSSTAVRPLRRTTSGFGTGVGGSIL